MFELENSNEKTKALKVTTAAAIIETIYKHRIKLILLTQETIVCI